MRGKFDDDEDRRDREKDMTEFFTSEGADEIVDKVRKAFEDAKKHTQEAWDENKDDFVVLNLYRDLETVSGVFIDRCGSLKPVDPTEDTITPVYPTLYSLAEMPINVADNIQWRLEVVDESRVCYPPNFDHDDPMWEIPESFDNDRALKAWLELNNVILIVNQLAAKAIGHRRVLCPDAALSYAMMSAIPRYVVGGWTVYG